MKYFLQKFWILLFGLLTAHGIPQHEIITESAEPEYLSPVTPLFVLNTMEDLLSNYMNNNITDLEKATELVNEIFGTDTTLGGPESKMLNDITSTDKSVLETESTSKVTSISESTTLVSNPGGTQRSTMNITTNNNIKSTETNSESIIQTTENVNNKKTSIDIESTRQTDTTSENTKIITSTENIVTSTKTIRESATFSETVRTESSPDFTSPSKITENKNQLGIKSPTPQQSTEPGIDTKSADQFTTTERASSIHTIMSEPVNESQLPSTEIPSTENIVTSTQMKRESSFSEAVRTEGPDVTSPSKTTEYKNQLDIKSPTLQQSTQPGFDTKSPDKFTTTEGAPSIHTVMSEPVTESQSQTPSTEILLSTENIVTSTKRKRESATISEDIDVTDNMKISPTKVPQYQPDVTSAQQSTEPGIDTKSPDKFTTTERASSIHTIMSVDSEAVSTEEPQHQPDVNSPSKTTQYKNQLDIKSPTLQQSTQPGFDTKSPEKFTTTEGASSIHTIMSEPVTESQSQSPSSEITSTANIVTPTKTKTESATFSETVRTENQLDIKSPTPQPSTEPGINTKSPDKFTTTEGASSIHTIMSEPVNESQSPSIEITSTENYPSIISSSKTTAIEDKTESIESTDKQDNFSIPFHSDVNSKPTTTYASTSETVAIQTASEISHESGRTTTVIISKATTISGADHKNESTEIGEHTSPNFVFENLITDSLPNLTVTNNCSTITDPVAPARHENDTTINYDKQNKTIPCNEIKTETPTIKPTAITTTFRPRPAVSSISKHTQLTTSSTTNPTTTSTTKRNSHITPKESDATTPQIASIILISISFFYCHILMKTYNLRIW